ncbi:MAG: hypothetical protein LVQ96_02620 [Thermoplasmatales archaeon]|nr:hypothetical protein [Thermoplasmatales archaeon]MCW6170045.1 hypothetical protein [Thermoplasmatales archaeon]
MDENGNLIPQNMTPEFSIHSSSITYEEYRNNNVTLIVNNVMTGNTIVNSSAMIVNNLNYPVEYIVSFDLVGERSYFTYGSSVSLLNGTSTNISGIPVRWQSNGFVRGVKAYSNGTNALIIPYAVDLRSGGAFFIDPTIGKKPLGESCSIYYYGDISATLNAPSSTALGDTITLSVTINSLSGSSPRKVNFYISGGGQTQNIHSTSVTDGNTYTASWTDNIIGNITFCANYLYDRETYDYRGHVYTSYWYSSLGSVSIHMDTNPYKWIGYDGNNAIYLSSVGFTPPINLINEKGSTKINEKNGYRENAFAFNVSYSQAYTSNNNQEGCLLTNLYLSGSGIVATDCYGIGGPYVMLQGQLNSGPSGSYLSVASGSDYSVHMGDVNSSGNSNAGEIASLMIGAFSLAASIAAPEFSIPLGVLGVISSALISSVHETSGATTKVEDSGKVWQCFVLNGDDTSTYGSIERANYSAGTRLKLTLPANALRSTGSSLTILGCSVGYDGNVNFSKTIPLVPAYAIYGSTENSNNVSIGGVNLYFNPAGTDIYYEVTSNNYAGSSSYSDFVFYANSYTTYNVFYGPNVYDLSYVGNLPNGGHSITTGGLGSSFGPRDFKV